MSKALYREYRPRKLSEVVGQEHITDTLSRAIKKGAISHAYLFTGPKGVGKTSIARILAHEINNVDYSDESTHLDIIEIDAASNRRIDEIRDLRDKVHIAPTSAKYKVYIIDEVHMLTREAFNALLKTLEEPPEHAVFILATTEAHKVPDTIQSRTQRYSFRPIGNQDVVAHLRSIADQEKITIDDDALLLLAEHGNGSFRDSISLLDQIASYGHKQITKQHVADLLGIPDDELLAQVLQTLSTGESGTLFDLMQRLREQGGQPAIIAQRLIQLLRDQLIQKQTIFSAEKSVALMKDLLPITAQNSSYEALEIILLDHMSTIESTKVIPEPVQPTTSVEPEEVTALEPELKQEKVVEQSQAIEKKPETSADWSGILQSLKGQHNTLYGILRMAEAEVQDREIILTFKFAFHKKQLDQGKHLEILRQQAEKTLGTPHTITAKIGSKAPQPTPPPETKKTDDLTAISNIFGDAELLE